MDRQKPKRSLLGWVRRFTRKPKETATDYHPEPVSRGRARDDLIRSVRVGWDSRTLAHRVWVHKRACRRIARASRQANRR